MAGLFDFFSVFFCYRFRDYLIVASSSGCSSEAPEEHIWELLGNSPVFTALMVIYHYVERTWRIIVNPNFCITYTIMEKGIQVNQLIYIYNH